MIPRLRRPIESYVDTRRAIDRAHIALLHALQKAVIDSPLPTTNASLRVRRQEPAAIARLMGRADDHPRENPAP
jgi:hypothetical protein